MVVVFKEKSSVTVIWLVALSFVVHSSFLLHPPQVLDDGYGIWLFSFLKPLQQLPDIALILLYHAIILVQALRFNVVLNNLRMFPRQYFLTALCYILLTAFYPAWGNITVSLLLNFAIIWIFSMIARLFNAPKSKPLIYNIGLVAGAMGVLYPPACYLILVVFCALAILRAFRTNEWMILLFGIITPIYFFVCILFLMDQLNKLHGYLPHFVFHIPTKTELPAIVVAICACFVLIFTGFFAWQSNTGKMTIHIRRAWNVLFLMFLLSIPLSLFLKNAGMDSLVLGLLPAAALGSNTFVYNKSNLFQTIFFWMLVGIIIYNNWFV